MRAEFAPGVSCRGGNDPRERPTCFASGRRCLGSSGFPVVMEEVASGQNRPLPQLLPEERHSDDSCAAAAAAAPSEMPVLDPLLDLPWEVCRTTAARCLRGDLVVGRLSVAGLGL